MAFIIAFLLTSSSGEEHNKMYNQFEIVHWKLKQFDLDIQPPFPSVPLTRFSGGFSTECG